MMGCCGGRGGAAAATPGRTGDRSRGCSGDRTANGDRPDTDSGRRRSSGRSPCRAGSGRTCARTRACTCACACAGSCTCSCSCAGTRSSPGTLSLAEDRRRDESG